LFTRNNYINGKKKRGEKKREKEIGELKNLQGTKKDDGT